MRLLAFILVSILLSPLVIMGASIYGYRVAVVLKRRGVDGTTYEPYTARLLMHDLGTKLDPTARLLAPHLTATAPPVWQLCGAPLRWAARLTGYIPTFVAFPPARPPKVMSLMPLRTEFFDRTLSELSEHVEQVVILGAGWDARAYDERWSDLKFFEVDERATLREKCAALASAQVDADHVTFVPVDFNEMSWLEALTSAGFDPSRPTYALLEGVSMQLDEAVMRDTLKVIGGLAPGSAIAFDYLPKELFTSRGLYGLVGRYIVLSFKIVYRREFKLMFPGGSQARDEVERILAGGGLTLGDYERLAYKDKYPVYGLVLATVR